MRGDADMSGIRLDLENFNSRLYMRGNEQCFVIGLREISFQFTPLHERQQNVTSEWRLNGYFNSRLYMRGNPDQGKNLEGRYHISIHASTWEATSICFTCQIHVFVFQFTPLHERQRELQDVLHSLNCISIHASTWEATYQIQLFNFISGYFNSRLYMRGNCFV